MADGFRIPIELDFSRSIRNVQDFRSQIRQALNIPASGIPAGTTPRQLTGQLGTAAGQLQAGVLASPVIGPADKQRLLRLIERETQAQARLLGGQMFGDDTAVRAPSTREIERSRGPALRRIEAAMAKEAVASERAAAAAEQAARQRQASLRGNQTTAGLGLLVPQGVPTAAELKRMQEALNAQVALQRTGAGSVFDGLGRRAGIGRQFGLRVGLAEERDDVFAGEESLALRTQLTMERRLREMAERSAIDQAIINNERQLLEESAKLRLVLRERQIAERAAVRSALATPEGRRLLAQEADDQIARERERSGRQILVAGRTTDDDRDTIARGRAAARTRNVQIEAVTLGETSASQAYIAATAQATVARRQQKLAIERSASQIQLQNLAPEERGTFLQRLQSGISGRRGVQRSPAEFQSGTQFFQSRFLTTAGFAASGALLYGGIAAVRELITEATELQQQMAILEAQYENAGAVGVDSFSQVREEIFRISRETGVMANEVADVTRQLAGAFADPSSGTPDFGRGLREAQTAFELAQVTKLPFQEITDSLTAAALAFPEDDFRSIADTIIGLEQQFGVLSPDIIKFTADLAPLGAALGFTNEQLSALGAIAQQSSGRSGGVLAEQFGRILPELTSNAAGLIALFQQNTGTRGLVSQLGEELAQNDVPAVLRTLVEGYQQFSDAQRNSLASLLGGRREAASLFAVLERGDQVLRALDANADLSFTGSLDERFDNFRQTVTFAFQELQRSVEEFGLALFEAGIADALVNIATSGRIVADVARELLEVFVSLDDATDGWLTRLLGIGVAMYGASRAMRFLGRLSQDVTKAMALGRGAAAAGAAGQIPGQLALFGASRAAPAAAAGGGLFSGSRFGAVRGVGGVVGANAGLLAGAATILAVQLRDNLQEDLGSAYAQLKETALQSLREGADADEIIRIAREFDDGINAGGRAALFISGEGLPSDAVTDAAQAFLAPLFADQLNALAEAINEGFSNVTLPSDSDIVLPPGYEFEDHGGTGSNVYTRGEEYDPARIRDLVRRLLEDPENNNTFDEVKSILDAAGADPEIQAMFTRLDEGFRASVREAMLASEAVERLGDVDRVQSLEEMRAAVEAGEGSLNDLQGALEQQLADLQLLLRTFESQGAGEEQIIQILNQISGIRSELAGVAEQARFGIVDQLRKISGNAGIDSPELNIRIAEFRLNLSEDPQDRYESALQIQQALREQFEARLGDAADAAERSRIIAEGFQQPPEVTRALAEGFVQDQSVQPYLERLAATLNLSLQTLSDQIVRAVSEGRSLSEAVMQFRRGLAERAARFQRLVAELDAQNKTNPLLNASVRAREHAEQVANSTNSKNEEVNEALEQLDLLDDILSGAFESTVTPDVDAGSDKDAADDLARRIADARLAVARARAGSDPVRLAQLAIEAGRVAQIYAEDKADELNALAQVIEGETQLRAALRDVQQSGLELAAAMYGAVGEDVNAARVQLNIARNNLSALRAERAGQAEINRAIQQVVAQEANLRQAVFQDSLGDIDYLLDLEKITIQQAIRMLEALMQIPGNTEEMVRDLERRIRSLRDELGRDFQFNLPSDIAPTFYEARRFNQTAGAYQDNRVISLQFNANNVVEAQAIFDQLVDELSRPTRFATVPRRF